MVKSASALLLAIGCCLVRGGVSDGSSFAKLRLELRSSSGGGGTGGSFFVERERGEKKNKLCWIWQFDLQLTV